MPIDFNFIRELEGFSSSGYVPEDQPGGVESGVTIGTGIDLGSKSLKGVQKAGVSKEVLKLLRPYIGKRGREAANLLIARPITLSQQQVSELDSAVMNRDFGQMIRQFEKESNQKFNDLPDELQTTMASVTHQYGSLKNRTPDFWGQMTGGQYDKALENLRDFGDIYPTRRNKEADLFQQGLITDFLKGVGDGI